MADTVPSIDPNNFNYSNLLTLGWEYLNPAFSYPRTAMQKVFASGWGHTNGGHLPQTFR